MSQNYFCNVCVRSPLPALSAHQPDDSLRPFDSSHRAPQPPVCPSPLSSPLASSPTPAGTKPVLAARTWWDSLSLSTHMHTIASSPMAQHQRRWRLQQQWQQQVDSSSGGDGHLFDHMHAHLTAHPAHVFHTATCLHAPRMVTHHSHTHFMCGPYDPEIPHPSTSRDGEMMRQLVSLPR